MDSSSDEEDIDAMLRRTSDKLGWSSRKNSDDTFKMLLKNVEQSKKKKKKLPSTRVRRQTPSSRTVKKFDDWDAREVNSTKRILSFETCLEKSPADSSCNVINAKGDKKAPDVLLFQKDLTINTTNGSDCSKLEQDMQSTSETFCDLQMTPDQKESAGCNIDLGNCSISEPNVDFVPSENCAQLGYSLSEKKYDLVEDNSGCSSVDDSAVTAVNCETENGGQGSMTQSWCQYRERNEEKSEDEDGTECSNVQIKRDSHSGVPSEEASDPDLPALSLSQRLLKIHRSRKAAEVKRNGSDKSAECKEESQIKVSGRCAGEDEVTSNVCSGNISSSDDEDFEKFLLKMKTPVKIKPKTIEEPDADKDFINDDPFTDSEDNDPVFYFQQDNKERSVSSVETPHSVLGERTNKSRETPRVIVLSSSDSNDDDDEDVFKSPVRPKWIDKKKDKENIPSSLKTPVNRFLERKRETFLESLDTPPVGTPVRSAFVKDFKKRRTELTAKLFTLFNKTVFENKLPHDLEILWNKRMRKTAGYCVYSKGKLSAAREVRIELSEKVCDSAERLRDTLVHEMCHAACWLIHGVNDGHGRFWKYWAAKANLAHPEIPVVKRCHSYEIHTKFNYQCQQCKAIVGRHSKSLDVNKKCCGLCHGRFVLLPPENSKERKRQQPNKFAMFVKENYASVKKSNKCFKHADVMRLLSQEFAQKAKVAD